MDKFHCKRIGINEFKFWNALKDTGLVPEFKIDGTYLYSKKYPVLSDIHGDVDEKAVLEATKKLHSLGILHGDLHQGNILLDGNRCYFIDFEYTQYRRDITAEDIEWFNDRFSQKLTTVDDMFDHELNDIF